MTTLLHLSHIQHGVVYEWLLYLELVDVLPKFFMNKETPTSMTFNELICLSYKYKDSIHSPTPSDNNNTKLYNSLEIYIDTGCIYRLKHIGIIAQIYEYGRTRDILYTLDYIHNMHNYTKGGMDMYFNGVTIYWWKLYESIIQLFKCNMIDDYVVNIMMDVSKYVYMNEYLDNSLFNIALLLVQIYLRFYNTDSVLYTPTTYRRKHIAMLSSSGVYCPALYQSHMVADFALCTLNGHQ